MKVKHFPGKLWLILVLIVILIFVVLNIPGLYVPTVSTTTISVTTIPVTTTLKLTTTTLITTTTTTPMNVTPTTTVQVRKTISVIAYDCSSKTGIITLTISNRGNTRIEEDEIKIYINDEDKGTFGKVIEPGTSSKNTVQGSIGQNIVKVVAPSNSVRIVFWC